MPDTLLKRTELFVKARALDALLALSGGRPPYDLRPLRVGPKDKLLFIRLHRIGDSLVTTPLLKAVKDQTGAQVHVLADRRNHFVFRTLPFVDAVHQYKGGLKGMRAVRALCRREGYTAVIDTHDQVSATVSFMVALSGVPARLALSRDNDRLFTHVVPRPNAAETHVIDRIMRLAELLSVAPRAGQVNVHYPLAPASRAEAAARVREAFPDRGEALLVGVNLSAGSAARTWAPAHWARLIAQLGRRGCRVLLLCAPADVGAAEQVQALVPGTPLYYDKDFMRFAAVLPELDLLITPDTSLVHLASASHLPVFALYVSVAPTLFKIWYPYASDYATFQTTDSTLASVTPDDVLAALLPFLDRVQARHAARAR